jgi:hypothetical protein
MAREEATLVEELPPLNISTIRDLLYQTAAFKGNIG